MILHRSAGSFAKVQTTNATDAAFIVRAATTTAPADAGVVTLGSSGGPVPVAIEVIPYVLGADDETFSIRVIGWAEAAGLWIPTILCEYDYIGSTSVGVAGATVLNTERFADTLTIVANMGTNGEGVTKVSPANNTPGHFIVNVDGCQKVEFLFKKGTGTSGNALWRAY